MLYCKNTKYIQKSEFIVNDRRRSCKQEEHSIIRVNYEFSVFYVIDKKALFKIHSDADVNRSLSRDPCWTFRSQSSVFYFLESLDFDPQSFHGTIDGIKTRQYCSRANVFFFWIQSLRRKLSKKIFHKISFTQEKPSLYTIHVQGSDSTKTNRKYQPRSVSPKMSSRFSKFREHGCSIKCSKQFAILIQNLHRTKPAMQLWRSKVPAGLSFHSGFLFILCT